MTDPSTQVTLPKVRPPIDETRKALERGARSIATLLARRGKYQRKLAQCDDELSQARKLLRDLIRDTATPAEPGVQLTTADVSAPEEP